MNYGQTDSNLARPTPSFGNALQGGLQSNVAQGGTVAEASLADRYIARLDETIQMLLSLIESQRGFLGRFNGPSTSPLEKSAEKPHPSGAAAAIDLRLTAVRRGMEEALNNQSSINKIA